MFSKNFFLIGYILCKDLKSENIFIQVEGLDLNCAIGDLDTAKVLSRTSKAKTIIGTPSFIAPEVLTSGNQTAYSSKADSKFNFFYC